jgi:hypothetical protein
MSSSQKSNFSLVVYISRTKTKKNGEVPVVLQSFVDTKVKYLIYTLTLHRVFFL